MFSMRFFKTNPARDVQIGDRMENRGHGYAVGEYRNSRGGEIYNMSIRLRREGRQIVIGSLYINR